MDYNQKDIIRNILIGASASTPYTGGMISYALDKIFPSYLEKHYIDLISDLERDLYEIHKKIDLKTVESPEFISLCYKAIEYAIVEYHKEKLQGYRNILLHAITGDIDFSISDYYLFLTDRLTIDQFKILHLLYLTESFMKPLDDTYLLQLMNAHPENRYLYISEFSELTRLNLSRGNILTQLGKKFYKFINTPIKCFNELN